VTPFICTAGAKLTRASLVIIERLEVKGITNYYNLLIIIILNSCIEFNSSVPRMSDEIARTTKASP